MSKKFLIIVCICALPFISSGCAQQELNHETIKPEIKTETKVEETSVPNENIEKLLRDPVYVYHKTVESLKEAEKISKFELSMCQHRSLTEFYNQLFDDFKSGNNIEIIEPVIQTNNFEDEKLQAYFNNCPKLKEDARYNINRYRDIQYHPTDDPSKYIYVREYVATSNFKLFNIDFDNTPDNGKQHLFYSGGYFKFYDEDYYREPKYGKKGDKTRPSNDIYSVLDLNTCNAVGSYTVRRPIDYITMEVFGDYNGVIKYKGKYYIYEAVDHTYKAVVPTFSIGFYRWKYTESPDITNITIISMFSRNTADKK